MQYKKDSISILINTASKKRVQEELEKCIVLCSNCHRDLHYKENIDSGSTPGLPTKISIYIECYIYI